MEHENLKIRAIIFDVYATLLQVGAPPSDADGQWNKLFENVLGEPAPLSRFDFSVRTQQVIAQRHAAARSRGIQWPEISWPSVVVEVLPALEGVAEKELEEFIFRQMQIGRSLRLMLHAGEFLCALRERGKLLGIASNSQRYTLRELSEALRGAGLNLSIFEPDLCFWSFQNGFSKPDPYVFQILTARLEARGISARETLMIGDRPDNDIEPARAHGWQTWQLLAAGMGDGESTGDFRQLLVKLA